MELFIPLRKETINKPSKVLGYNKFNAMTEEGHKIFDALSRQGLNPLFTIKDETGQYARDDKGQLVFTGIIIHLNVK